MLPFLKSIECIEVLEFDSTAAFDAEPTLLFSCGIDGGLSSSLRAKRAFVKSGPTLGRVEKVDFELTIKSTITAAGHLGFSDAPRDMSSVGAGAGAGAGVGAGAGDDSNGDESKQNSTSGAASDAVAAPRGASVKVQRWLVCNQWYGEGLDDDAFFDRGSAHLRLIPWAGVAAVIADGVSDESPPAPVQGQAYCTLPLPIDTGLPVHVRGAKW